MDAEHFAFIYTTRFDLSIARTARDLRMKDSDEEERLCAEGGILMQDGFCFESDATQHCSEECLTKVITWEDYLAMHDNGDVYWTE